MDFETSIELPDGRVFFARTNGQPIFSEDNLFLGYRGTGTDITSQKEAELETKRLEEHLQQAQKMETLGTLAGGIAHDFNNTLTPIIGTVQLMLQKATAGGKEHERLERISRAAFRGANLVKRILSFSRQDAHDRSDIEIGPIVNETVNLISSTAPTTIDIRLRIDPQCANIQGDATQVHQLIMNLCTNALQAMEDGGGVLEVELENFTVDTMFARRSQGLEEGPFQRLRVSDTGCGMDDETKSRIFDPFFTTKSKTDGTGLGLATVHGVITSHKGHIDVYSEPGKGTTFNVYFPAIADHSNIEGDKNLGQMGGDERLMFVDDEMENTVVADEILSGLGYAVTTFTDSEAALEEFKSRPSEFDAVITDQTMPNMTGDVLAAKLREVRSDIPIIMVTGYSAKVSRENAKSAGINEFLMKPLISETLDNAIRTALA
ncbi:MAG: response regulator [Rhodospirillaceae bacterium]|nr:response regulator [Rhodospirillaceae bacterium]